MRQDMGAGDEVAMLVTGTACEAARIGPLGSKDRWFLFFSLFVRVVEEYRRW